jgi:glycosyltransferase involved in cell wall biosynthesis
MATWKILYEKHKNFDKITGIITGFFRRALLLFSLKKYDFVFIHRESAPVGPPVFEWIIAKVFRKKIIYDFDDAIWVKTSSEANPMAAAIKCTWKVKNICRYSYIVSAGNEFLATYARQYCKDVRVIPTVVDTDHIHNRLKDQRSNPLVIGWTGTFTNLRYLKIVTAAIGQLQHKYDFTFLIISNKDPYLKDVNYTFLPWKASSEIDDLLKFNIGIMPLEDTEIEKGKCAFKAIQYMSLGIPAVVSPVGANCTVISNNVNGYWANNEKEWYDKLEKLLTDENLRIEMGKKSRIDIINQYSVASTVKQFFNLFK